MKRHIILYVFATFFVAMMTLSCSDENKIFQDTEGLEQEDLEFEDIFLDAVPTGQTDLSISLTLKGAWTVAADATVYSWIEPTMTIGNGDATLVFDVTSNKSGGARTAIFKVREGRDLTYRVTISQDALGGFEYNVNASDLMFLQAVVDGKLLGDKTPTITDWKDVPSDVFPGITLEKVSSTNSNQLYVTRIDGAPLTAFPAAIDLPELTQIQLRGIATLTGKKLPSVWSTPKCAIVTLAHTGLTGTIPQGIANIPVLNQIYLDGCDFYGALPHIWASKKIEAIIINSGNTRLGYLVPAQFDVPLNQYDSGGGLINESRDKTQMKLAGTNWTGFEKGWGQQRYEKYDGGAKIGDKTIWSEHRLLIDDWAWYFSDLGMVPKVLSDWDQAAADAYTASCEKGN